MDISHFVPYLKEASSMEWLYFFTLFVALAFSENPEENAGVDDSDLFEGDMLLTAEQRMAARLGLDIDNPLGRGSTKGKQWPRGLVPYVIDSELARHPKALAAVKGAISEWTSKTCIRFKKRTNEFAFVNFRRASGGCSSYVGRTGSQQDINLADGCWKMGIVAHEIGHALGFYHEQSRPDRDDYITIMWDNIRDAQKYNFDKYGRGTIDSLGTEYDYGSVMHYHSTAFTKNGKPTIVAKKSGVTFGQRVRVSDIDAKQMNLLYKTQCEEGEGGGGGDGGNSGCKDASYGCAQWICSFKPDMAKKSCQKTCGLC